MLGYRTIFRASLDDYDELELAVRAFRHWLSHKQSTRLDGDALEFGQPLTSGDARAFLLSEEGKDGSRAIRAVLSEINPAGRWTTTLTAAAPRSGPTWFWLDVDGPATRADGSGRRQWTSTPNLAKALLDQLPAVDGMLRLGTSPQRLFPEDVDHLIDVVCDPERRGLAFVAGTSHDLPLDRWSDLVSDVLGATAGLAGGYLLDPEATAAFAEAVGPSHQVAPGTIRTFRPGADPASTADGRRHRFLSTRRLVEEQPSHLRRILGWSARDAAIDRPLPRDAIRLDKRFEVRINELLLQAQTTTATPPTPAADVATLKPADVVTALSAALEAATGRLLEPESVVAEAIAAISAAHREPAREEALAERLAALTERAENYQQENADLREELDGERLDHSYTYEELIDTTRSRDWLRSQLVEAGRIDVAWGQQPVDHDEPPALFEEVLDRIGTLTHVRFTGDAEVTESLDEHDTVGRWPAKTWEALLAMNDYANAKASGEFSGGMTDYLKSPPPGCAGFSANRHAHQESETVRNSPKFRQLRVFPVPAEVDKSGEAYMGAHFKIVQAGMTSPRMHYLDCTGQDGHVYVGYIGPHLATSKTN